MKEVELNALYKRINEINVDPKAVERDALKNYLIRKQEDEELQDGVIRFVDEDDYAYFEKLSRNLGIDVAEILINL